MNPADDPHKRVSPADLRRGKLSVTDLRKMHLLCQTYLAEIGESLKGAEKEKLVEIPLDGVTQLARATDMLNRFANNLIKGIRSAKQERLS